MFNHRKKVDTTLGMLETMMNAIKEGGGGSKCDNSQHNGISNSSSSSMTPEGSISGQEEEIPADIETISRYLEKVSSSSSYRYSYSSSSSSSSSNSRMLPPQSLIVCHDDSY